jgi:hypothetical protein
LAGAGLGFSTTASAQHHHHRRHGGAEDAPAAPSPAAPDPEDAEYQPAIETANRGQREEALGMFRAIFERTHAPRALARMGTTEIQLGRWLAAEEHLQGALASSADPWIIAHRTPLVEALGRVQQNLADLEVVCPVEGAALSINGQPAGTFPLAHPVRVVRGNVTIDVTASGYDHARQVAAVISANARSEVSLVREVGALRRPENVAVAPAPSTAGVTPAPSAMVTMPSPSGRAERRSAAESPPPRGSTARTLSIASVALGGVGLVLGTIGLILRQSAAADFNNDPTCGNDVAGMGGPGCADSASTVSSMGTMGVVGLVGGGILGLTGAVLLWRSTSGERQTLALTSGPGDVGIALRGVW